MASGDGARPAGATRSAYASHDELVARGRAARARVSRSSFGRWSAPSDRADPLEILADQERTRVPELVPIRHARMAASPFSFFRGAAAVMATDLAHQPRTGLLAQLCGDAHLVNFGGFASPERDLVFDLNDFDETLPGPFEWDVQRLAASLEIAGRDRGFDETSRRQIVTSGVCAYREATREFATMRNLDVWYSKLDRVSMVERWGKAAGRSVVRNLARVAAKAESKNHLKAFNRLVRVEDGELRFASDPPLLVPVWELLPDVEARRIHESIAEAFDAYRSSLSPDLRHFYDRYRYVDLARKVVGVGSVGTRCWVGLMIGRDEGDPLFLQVKEAEASVLERHLGKSEFSNHGQRVVEGQRYMQAASDLLLGWCKAQGVDGVVRDFYIRQLWDWKVSGSIETMEPTTMKLYAEICGWTLARAHARSGDAAAIGAYLGAGDAFDRAMAEFAVAYADQNERDHAALVAAARGSRTEAAAGV